MNCNEETGIRYTVYSMNSINSDLQYDLWYSYGKDLSYEAAYQEAYDEAKQDAMDEAEEAGEEFDEDDFDFEAPDFCIDEPVIEGECQGVQYHIDWLGGAPILWVFHSPHIRTFGLGSPCIPNACDGDRPNPYGFEGYSVPADWLSKD